MADPELDPGRGAICKGNPHNAMQGPETCFCPTPLQHEREVQLDRYFAEIETAPTEAHEIFEGTSLMDHLATKAGI